MRYRHQLVDRGELLKEIDTTYNNHYDKNSVLWVKNIICKAKVKGNRKEPMGLIIVEFDKGNVITKCSNCGQDANITDKFCRNCGSQFVEAIECEWRRSHL